MIRFPPPLCSRNVILLRGNGHRPDKSHFLRPPKLVLEGVLYGAFSPPKIARYVLPPPFANSQLFGISGLWVGFWASILGGIQKTGPGSTFGVLQEGL